MLKIENNVLLADVTTFKIGGRARHCCEVENTEQLKEAIQLARQRDLPFFILGGGSNVLVNDKGFSGLVIKFRNETIRIIAEKSNIAVLEAGAGVLLKNLVIFCLDKSLSGFEWASGIPRATLGGVLYINAGAFGQKIADIVEKVFVFDANNQKEKEISFTSCQFGYKESIFKKNKNLIILKVVLKMEKKNKLEIEKEMKRVLEYRKNFHPMGFPSAGSVFKNPKEMPAAELIEKCGLKGKTMGKAQISKKHANFIINLGNAKASDVKKLITFIKKEVKQKFNIALEEEIEYLAC